MTEALRTKVSQMESAHENREADWHDLANKWKQFEEEAVAENARQVAVNDLGSHAFGGCLCS